MSDTAHPLADQELVLFTGNFAFLHDRRRWLAGETHALWFLLFYVLVLGALATFLTTRMLAVSHLHRELKAGGIVLKGTVTSVFSRGGGESGLVPFARCRWNANGKVFENDYQLLHKDADNGRVRQGQEIELVCLSRDPSQCEPRDQFVRSGSPLARLILVWAGVLAVWVWSFAKLVRARAFRTKGTLTTGKVSGFKLVRKDGAESPTTLRVAYSFATPAGTARHGESGGNPRNMVVSGQPWGPQDSHSDPKSYYVHVLYLPNMRHLVL